MKDEKVNCIAIYSYCEHGASTITFIDCSCGHILKTLEVDCLTNAYWNAHKKDLIVLDSVTYYLKLFDDVPKSKITSTDCCKETRRYSKTFPIAFKDKDCKERMELTPGDYVVNNCKIVNVVTEDAKFVKTHLSCKFYNIWEVNASRVEEPDDVTYHRDLDYFYNEMEDQGVCVSQITDEERAEHFCDYQWLAHLVADQYNLRILNYLAL